MKPLLILLLTLNLLNAKKIALLIGNSQYSFQPLSNPLNDVDGIYQTLEEIGFDNIKILKNASKSQMETALANFSQRAGSAEIALVYFSGHGMQVNNTNYMFPANTTAKKPVDLFGLVDLNYFIQSATSAKYGIVLVDACRNNPLVKYFQNGNHKGASTKKGLGQVEPTNGKVVIGFATSAGDTADDGTGNMSPYASALAYRLKEKDDIRNVLGKVGNDVSKKYNQNPIYRANLSSSIFLNGKHKKENIGFINKKITIDSIDEEELKKFTVPLLKLINKRKLNSLKLITEDPKDKVTAYEWMQNEIKNKNIEDTLFGREKDFWIKNFSFIGKIKNQNIDNLTIFIKSIKKRKTYYEINTIMVFPNVKLPRNGKSKFYLIDNKLFWRPFGW